MTNYNILISGYGDIGERVANAWLSSEASSTPTISALCRSQPSNSAVQWLAQDLDQTLESLPACDWLYHFMPPPSSGETDPRVTNLLSALERGSDKAPKKMLLLSTSAVYGDCQGGWVDESAPVKPESDRGKRRADAEMQWQQWAQQHGSAWVILRVPGIYGPGRLPLARLRQGLPMVEESLAPYTNRIHCDDLAQIAYLAMTNDNMQGIYNVADGEPGNMTQYFNAVADAAGLARPQQISMEDAQQLLSSGMLSYLSESRRLRIDKLLRDSGYRFLYPDLASGLAASI